MEKQTCNKELSRVIAFDSEEGDVTCWEVPEDEVADLSVLAGRHDSGEDEVLAAASNGAELWQHVRALSEAGEHEQRACWQALCVLDDGHERVLVEHHDDRPAHAKLLHGRRVHDCVLVQCHMLLLKGFKRKKA